MKIQTLSTKLLLIFFVLISSLHLSSKEAVARTVYLPDGVVLTCWDYDDGTTICY